MIDRVDDAAQEQRDMREFALVRVGTTLCAMPHGAPAPDGRPRAGRFVLRRVVPWQTPTPIPGTPAGLVLGVAPLGDEEGIERVEVVIDLAHALGLPSTELHRGKHGCILTYDDGDLVAGFAVDALVRRVQLAPPQGAVDLPFVQGLVLRQHGAASPESPVHEEWRVVDVDALMRHLAHLLRVPLAV